MHLIKACWKLRPVFGELLVVGLPEYCSPTFTADPVIGRTHPSARSGRIRNWENWRLLQKVALHYYDLSIFQKTPQICIYTAEVLLHCEQLCCYIAFYNVLLLNTRYVKSFKCCSCTDAPWIHTLNLANAKKVWYVFTSHSLVLSAVSDGCFISCVATAAVRFNQT